MSAARAVTAPRLFLLAGLAGFLLLAALVWFGRDYYTLPAVERPAHPRHDELRSSGRTGLACGVAGSLLMFANLTYLVRKRLARAEWLGSLRSWMAFHVLTGLMSFALIGVHTALLPRSSLAILALACFAIVVASGVLGRWIYVHVPRSPRGRELGGDELRARVRELRARIVGLGLEPALLDAGEPPDPTLRPHGLLATLRAAWTGNREVRREYQRLRDAVRASPALRADARRILPLARDWVKEQQWLARYAELRLLMGSWRFLHRWLAIVLLAVALFHILIAIRFGGLDWNAIRP